MSSIRRNSVAGLAAAVVIVGVTAAIRLALHPWLEDRATYLLFSLAILLTCVVAGSAAGALAALLSLIFGLKLTRAAGFDGVDVVEPGLFVLVAIGVISLVRTLRVSQARAVESEQRADRYGLKANDLAEELNLLIDGAQGLAIFMLDPAGNVAIWNKGAERLNGWSELEVLGKNTALFYPADLVADGKPMKDLARAAAEGKLEEEVWRVHKGGSEFLANVTITALKDVNGKLRGYAEFVSDITERRATEQALLTRESFLQSILSAVPEAIIVVDDEGTIISSNRAATQLFGYSEQKMLGINVRELIPASKSKRHERYISCYLRTGKKRIIGVRREVLVRRKDGSTCPAELSLGDPIEGPHRLFTGFIRDLTERHHADEQLASTQSELMHLSRVSAMGTMASTLAHELNQPITAVVNYAEAVHDLLDEPHPEHYPMMREALIETVSEAMRAGAIIRHMRNFVARGEVDKTVETLQSLVNDAAILGLMGAREKNVKVLYDLDTSAPPVLVLVDKVQIQQVLINLIQNAVEAMSESIVRRLSISSRFGQPGFVIIVVADSGPGVSTEAVEHLFTAFVSTKTKGMGLGLSICRTIVEANGGHIWMQPAPEGGTEFHFTLVCADLKDDNEPM